MKSGLTSHQLELILACFRQHPEIEKVILFGSRALGNFKPGSDIDLFIVGAKVTPAFVTRLFGQLNDEVTVPFQFDIIHAPTLPALQEHIDKHGVVIFQKGAKP